MTRLVTKVGDPGKAGWREWVGLAVLCLPTMLTTVDISVVFLALPHVSTDLGAGGSQQLWISDSYGFMMAGFLVTMGTLGDRIGRRRVLLAGAAAFIAASLLAAYSTSAEMLIGARALLGVAGATVMPSVLALISNMFQDPRQLGTAMGAWGTSIMLGLVLGPVVGGLLLGTFWWGSIFLMAVPIMALLLVTGPVLVPESRAPNAGRLDLVSVALSLAAILPLIYGLKELARSGWQSQPVAAIIVGAAVMVVFVQRQRKLANPLLDLRLFGNRALSAALLLALLSAFVMAGIGLVVTLFMQVVKGLTPLQVGLWLLTPSIVMIFAVNLAPVVARRVRPAYVLASAALLAAAGMVVIAQVSTSAGMATLLIGLIIIYVGGGADGILSPYLIMSSAPPEKAGSAGSLSSTVNEFGAALGIAVLGLLGAAVYRTQVTVPAGVPAGPADAARESIAGAVATAEQLPGQTGAELLDSARQAFTTGLHVVAIIAAVFFLGLAVLAVVGLRHIPAIARAAGEQHAGAAPDGAGTVHELAQA